MDRKSAAPAPPALVPDEIVLEIVTPNQIESKQPAPALADHAVSAAEWQPNLGPKLSRDHVDSRGMRTSAIGRRGEEAALAAERRRVRDIGLDETLVQWVSLDHPLAPFDIKSVDLSGEIYIEVKSTTSSDPSSPFNISQSELLLATRVGQRYMIYRVTSVDAAAPRVHRYEDPIAMLEAGTATLNAADAQMRFGQSATTTPEPQL